MTTELSKSRNGLPEQGFQQGVDLPREARKARRRLYPVSAVYTAYATTLVTFALRAGARPLTVAAWYLGGMAVWTYVEYVAHRYVLHGRFPDGPGPFRRLLHAAFDHLHYEHHARPWDGDHINGTLKDTGPFVVVLAALSFLAPLHTLPVLIAGLMQAYVLEEWVHHSVHFYRFKGRYFRYIKAHHLYHHSPGGAEVGYGLSNGLWDVIVGTRIPPEDRRLLYGPRVPPTFAPPAA